VYNRCGYTVTRAVAQTQAVECGPSVGCRSILAFVGYSGGRPLYGYRRSSIHRGTAGRATIHVSKPINTIPSPLPGSSGTVPPTSVAAPPVSLATVNTSGELTYVCIGVCTNPSRGQLQHRPRGTGSPAGTGAYANYAGHGLPTARPVHGRTARSNFGPRWGTSRRPGVRPRGPAIRLTETGYQSHW